MRRTVFFLTCILCLSLASCKDHSSAIVTPEPTRTSSIPPSGTVAEAPGFTAIGEVIGYANVVVKSRIDGQLASIHFQEGQDVQKGELLAELDPAPYQISLNEAGAKRARDSADLEQAKANLSREQSLLEAGIVSKQDFEKQDTNFRELEAAVQADQAAVDRATLDLSYTKIFAPISGRLSFKMIDVGNMVHQGDTSGIVAITQIQPIAVVFSIPPGLLPQLTRGMKARQLIVEVRDEAGLNLLERGEIVTVDSAIDAVTRTAKVKALFQNKKRELWPNQFVQIRVLDRATAKF